MPGYAPGMFVLRQYFWVLLLMSSLFSCRTPQQLRPREERLHVQVLDWVRTNPIPDGQKLRVDELYRNREQSVHVLQLEGSLPSLVNQTRDELVLLIQGEGTITLAEQPIRFRAGDLLRIPKGMVHSVQVQPGQVCFALLVFHPPFDPKDQVAVQ